MFFSFLALMFMPALAQGEEIVPPGGLIDFVSRLQELLGSFGGVALSLPVLAAIVVGFLNLEGKALKYFFTGLIALTLVLMAFFLSFGYLYGAAWWFIPVNWVVLMVGAILGYAIPFLKTILDAIADKFNPWKPKEV